MLNKKLLSRLLLPAMILLCHAACRSSKNANELSNVYKADSLLLFAHRGIAANFPENSAAAINAAKRKGFKAIEIDVQQTGSGDMVIFHDEDGNRLLNVDSSIDKMETSTIKKHPLIFKKSKTGNYVLTLEEVLATYKNEFIIYLDVKSSGIRHFRDIVKVIEKHHSTQQVIFASSSAKCIFFIELFHPRIITALEGFNAGKEWINGIIPGCLKPDFYSGSFKKVTREHIQWLSKKNLWEKRIVFDVDSSNFNAVVNAGFKNIIVDHFDAMESDLLSKPAQQTMVTATTAGGEPAE